MAASLPHPPPAAYRYLLPKGPAAETAVAIGHVRVAIGLSLSGELEVLAAAAEEDAEPAALVVLGSVARGMMVRDLGSATPSISAAVNHRFTQRHHDFRAPNTAISMGDCEIGYTQEHEGVRVTVAGEVAYALEVTAERPPSTTAPRGWFKRHEKELASIGLVLLVAAPITRTGLTPRPAEG